MFLYVFFSLEALLNLDLGRLKVGRFLGTLLFVFFPLGALLDLNLGRLKVGEAFGNITDVLFHFFSF
jgi:hypothetical protein